MSGIDEAEWAKLQALVRDMDGLKDVSAESRDATAGFNPAAFVHQAKQRIEVLEKEGGVAGIAGEKERKGSAIAAELVAVYAASESLLSAKAQSQFDGFLNDGFRSRQDLDALSVFLSENSEILTFRQRVEIVDEVLDGAARNDYGIDEIPDKVILEVGKVLDEPGTNRAVMAELEPEKAALLANALSSGDPDQLRQVLKNEAIFAATHEQVAAVRAEFEAQERSKDQANSIEESKMETATDKPLSEQKNSIGDLEGLDPTSLQPQNSATRDLP